VSFFFLKISKAKLYNKTTTQKQNNLTIKPGMYCISTVWWRESDNKTHTLFQFVYLSAGIHVQYFIYLF